MRKVILVTGGVRSGKSGFALSLADRYVKRAYLATAEAVDREMRERIERHRRERGDRYLTLEEPLELAAALERVSDGTGCVVVECLTTWVGNMIHHLGDDGEIEKRIEDFIGALVKPGPDVVVVTNEVGLGIVPASEESRQFVDVLGRLNRLVADLANEVYLMVCGIPVLIKGGER